MSTQNIHQAAINVLARRIASAHDITEANSFAPALAALVLDEPRPLDLVDPPTTGGVTGDQFGTPTPVGPGDVANKTLQCTTTFRVASTSVNADSATVAKELKSTTLSAQQRTALEQKQASLQHQLAVAIASYTQCLRRVTAV